MADFPACQVCLKIMAIFKIATRKDDVIIHHTLGKLSDVIGMPCPHSNSIRKLWEKGKPHDMPAPEPWSVEIVYFGLEPIIIRFFDSHRKFHHNVDLVANGDPEHLGTSILLDSRWIHSLLPRYWYSQCLDEHGSECDELNWMNLHPGTDADPDWLIDVMDQCIVPFSSDTGSYVTLSYTWGNVQCLQTTTGNLNRLREVGSICSHHVSNISQTVRDAIRITKYLGERYLWVDSLCIVQDDKDSLTKNLNSMHRIYANSALCLVAYAGTDANHGLRGLEGISAPRRIEQSTLDIAGGEKLSYFNNTRTPIYPNTVGAGSTYDHPGWTYQEFIFAKRRLIFTDGPLRWICAKAKLGEETQDELDRDGWTYEMTRTYWVNDRLPSFDTLDRVISSYNTRHFTYQPDVLRAFLGIQNHLHGVFHGGLNYGHPEMFFDISLAWQAFLGVTRRSVSTGVSSEEDNLPSWSWMGWQGEFHFTLDAEHHSFGVNDGFTEPVAEWFTMESPSPSLSNMRLVSCRWHHYKTRFESEPSQVLDGWEVYTAGSGSRLCRVVSNSGTEGSKYPVPIPSSTEAIQPIEQRKFLFSKTSRCHFVTRPVVSSMFKIYNGTRLKVELWSTNGEFAGFLHLHQASEVGRFLALGTVELVAVAKGWTTDLDDFLHVAFQEQEEVMATQSLAAALEKISRLRTAKDKTRYKCYFVLCIHWENGVAKRQGSGKVFLDVWEKNQEPVDLILG